MGTYDPTVARIWREIYNIFINDWDPIGVNGSEGAKDEYNSYISGAYSLILKRASENEIYKYLTDIEVKRMGLPAWGRSTKIAAEKLSKIDLENS